LFGVAARSSTDVWAVGKVGWYDPESDGSFPPYSTLIEHWNGTGWRLVASPRVTGALYDIALISASDGWAVGASSSWSLVEHWNGRRWLRVTVPFEGPLDAVSAVAAKDVWAVGTDLSSDAPVASILHWDGAGWKQVARLEHTWLSDVVALSPRDVWVVGDEDDKPLAMRWNGDQWRSFALPYDPAEFTPDPESIAALSANDVWAAGSAQTELNYTMSPWLWHWNGKRWLIPAPGPGGGWLHGTGGGLHDIALRAPAGIWTTGYDEFEDVFDGSFVYSRSKNRAWDATDVGEGRYLNQLAVAPTGDLWGVGIDYNGEDQSGLRAYTHGAALIERYGC
jgi:hypothetical protein